jgi:demethylmenaquinone methyltransferase/2-methoxy-6-polyprenyl-1,4-benzoquinol methylase
MILGSAIQKLYTQIPSTYELINHLLTFGLDIWWRKNAIKKVENLNGTRWLDVCTGTGETAAYLSRYARNGNQVFATDFSLPMVSIAKNKPEGKFINFSISEIKNLPFLDDTFDLITISFATRNIDINREILIQNFSEIRRVLKSGGQFINLETSQPTYSFIKYFFHLYVKIFIRRIGTAISGSKSAYAYLAATIPKFYPAKELKQILIESGFQHVDYQQMLMGAAAIHSSIK